MIDSLYPLLKILFPFVTWKVKTSEKTIYLTFDDGPIPGLTEFVLDELKKYNFKATFFCVGDNIRKHPSVFNRLCMEGHAIGNHTYHHIKGWKTSAEKYWEDIGLWEQEFSKHSFPLANIGKSGKPLFRPPYGRFTRAQYQGLKQKYEIVMWNVLTQDYNASLTAQQVLQKAIRGAKPGAIIVFHDNLKAEQKLKSILPVFLEYLHKNSFTTATL
jgi:peptidoglycan/xylan/chitin deacetylase (PgdA/CDA1 family)